MMLLGVEDVSEEGGRESNGNSSFNLFKAYQGQKIQGYIQLLLRRENQSCGGEAAYMCWRGSCGALGLESGKGCKTGFLLFILKNLWKFKTIRYHISVSVLI